MAAASECCRAVDNRACPDLDKGCIHSKRRKLWGIGTALLCPTCSNHPGRCPHGKCSQRREGSCQAAEDAMVWVIDRKNFKDSHYPWAFGTCRLQMHRFTMLRQVRSQENSGAILQCYGQGVHKVFGQGSETDERRPESETRRNGCLDPLKVEILAPLQVPGDGKVSRPESFV